MHLTMKYYFLLVYTLSSHLNVRCSLKKKQHFFLNQKVLWVFLIYNGFFFILKQGKGEMTTYWLISSCQSSQVKIREIVQAENSGKTRGGVQFI